MSNQNPSQNKAGGTPPGQGGTSPGQGGSPPGQGNTPPGQSGATSPGQGGPTPGASSSAPGQAKTASGDSSGSNGSSSNDSATEAPATPVTTAPTTRERPTALTLTPLATNPSSNMAKGLLRWIAAAPPAMGGSMVVQFNPSELVVTKETKWEGTETPSFNAPILQYGGGQSASYSLSLIFDAYAQFDQSKVKEGDRIYDVRQYTNQLLRLTLRNEGWAMFMVPYVKPPLVQFIWGSLRMFWAVITKVEITYTMFAMDGTPIRAKANVEFLQQDPAEDLLPAQNPTSRSESRRTRITNSHQRLDLIAHEEYGDSRYWRLLAEANNLDDPFQLQDGQMLVIPQPDLTRYG